MPLSNDFLMELKYRNDIESVISPYVKLKRQGNRLVGLCPFHNEKTPSFSVNVENNYFYCFGCQTGGDIITFIMKIENLDYMEAVKLLAERSGMEMPQDGFNTEKSDHRKDVLEANRLAARFFAAKLLEDEGRICREYLTKRGLSVKTIRHFGLGFAPDSWDSLYKFLKFKGVSEDVMISANLVIKSDRSGKIFDKFRNRVVFPFIDLRGNVIAFSCRKLREEDKGGKYINSSDTPVFKKGNNLFGMNFAKTKCADRLIIVEGNVDVVSLHQAGFENTVAALGTAFTEEQARMIAKYTKKVVLTYDMDKAGRSATNKAMAVLDELGVEIKVVSLPDASCKDPDEFIKKHGASKFAAVLDDAVSDIEYKLFMAAEGISAEGDAGKLEYLKKAAIVLAESDDDMTIDLYAGRLSKEYEVSKQSIIASTEDARKKLKRRKYKKELGEVIDSRPKNEINPEKIKFRRAAVAEENFLSAIMRHPDLYDKVKEQIKSDMFVTSLNGRVYEAVCEALENNDGFDLILISEKFTPQEMGYISMLQISDAAKTDPEGVVKDCIEIIREEKEKSGENRLSELSDDEWEEKMRKIAERRK